MQRDPKKRVYEGSSFYEERQRLQIPGKTMLGAWGTSSLSNSLMLKLVFILNDLLVIFLNI